MNTINIKCHPTKRNLILKKPIEEKIDVQSVGDSKHRKFQVSCKKKSSSVKLLSSMDILQACVTRNQCLLSPEHPRCISYKLDRCICKKIPYMASQKI